MKAINYASVLYFTKFDQKVTIIDFNYHKLITRHCMRTRIQKANHFIFYLL